MAPAQGDELGAGAEALGAKLEDAYPGLVAAVAAYTRSVPVAEDIAQDAILSAWERRSRLGDADVRRWVFRVAINRSRSWHRRALVELRHLPDLIDLPSARVPSEDGVVVRAALRTLPARQRLALVLRFYGDFSVDEVAELMGCAPGTVKALTSQGLSSLRSRLWKDDG